MKRKVIIGIILMLSVTLTVTAAIFTARSDNDKLSQLISENIEALSQVEGVGQGYVEKIQHNIDFITTTIEGITYDCVKYEQICVGSGDKHCAYRISYDCKESIF